MPRREEPFVNHNIYHTFNKTIEEKRVFNNNKNCGLFLDTLKYYRSTKASVSYSKLDLLEKEQLKRLLKLVSYRKYFKIDVLAFCLMPNHFHLLLRQRVDNGILKHLSDVINSFTRFYNLKNERKGPLFLTQFKSVRIKSEAQLVHVSRYIHLNPFSSGLINNTSNIKDYNWSSLKEYLNNDKNGLSYPSSVISIFDNNQQKYLKFILDNAIHQQMLEYTKHTKNW